jgi:hypothetical protein
MAEKSTQSDPLAEAKLTALRTPHALFVVDQLLKVKADGDQVQVSLGWLNPTDGVNAVTTLVMPASFAARLKEALPSKK